MAPFLFALGDCPIGIDGKVAPVVGILPGSAGGTCPTCLGLGSPGSYEKKDHDHGYTVEICHCISFSMRKYNRKKKGSALWDAIERIVKGAKDSNKGN